MCGFVGRSIPCQNSIVNDNALQDCPILQDYQTAVIAMNQNIQDSVQKVSSG